MCQTEMLVQSLRILRRSNSWLATGGLVLAIVVGLGVLPAQSVYAHANLADADPAPNSVLDDPPERLTIWFTEPLEPTLSDIQVLDSNGQRVDNDDSTVDPNDSAIMSVTLQDDLPNGTYTVGWRNLSTVDGHTIRGTFFFSVGEPLSAVPVDVADEPLLQSAAEPFMRWVVLLGGLTVLGGLTFWLVVLRPALSSMSDIDALVARLRQRVYWTLTIGIVVALVGSVGHLIVQASSVHVVSLLDTIGESIGFVVSETNWGRGWLQRTVLFVGAAGPVAGLTILRKSPLERRDNALFVSAFLVTALAILTLSMTSHGAATSGIESAAIVTDYLHALASSFWVGGLFTFALAVPVIFVHAPPGRLGGIITAVLPRFSLVAGLSVGTLIITGLYSAWAQVTIVPALVVPYGLTLLAKTALVGMLILLGATNLLWLTPAIRQNERAASRLRWTVTSEALIGVLVVLSAGYLTSLEPARQVASREGIGSPDRLTFEDTVEGASILWNIKPGQVGPNVITVSLTDRRGQPITNATGVDVRLSYLNADLGEEFLSTDDDGSGNFVATDAPINIAGPYQVEVAVRRPNAFDARTAFRFETVTGGGVSSSAISPSADTGKLLFGVELLVLGFLFLAVGIPLGGWYSWWGLTVMGPGLAGFMVGAVVVFTTQFAETETDVERNPFTPNPESLAIGSEVYDETCQACHGASGLGDGPAAPGLEPPPADLIVHVPLHSDKVLFDFIHGGIEGTAMVGLGDQYTDEQIWHVINYVKTLE